MNQMRDLKEINIDGGGVPVDTPPPTSENIQEFQEHFGVVLPAFYLQMLTFSNGGSPEVDSFPYLTEGGDVGESSVDVFFHLSGEHDDYSVWHNTELLREVLGRNGLVAIAENAGSDLIYLDLADGKENVHILYRSSGNATPKVADSFESFIDSLFLNPDYT